MPSRRGIPPQLSGPAGWPTTYIWRTRQPEHEFAIADSNQPLVWLGDLLLMYGSAGHAYWATGRNVREIAARDKSEWTPILWDNSIDGGRWMEAVIADDDGTLYGWYHNEPGSLCPVSDNKTAPLIGAGMSTDAGRTWKDLGIIISPPPNQLECRGTPNVFFNGGNGDESVILDQNKEYLYIFYSVYSGLTKDQGVAVARMKWSDRRSPRGKVWKYNGIWEDGVDPSPGLGGYARPIFTSNLSWHEPGSNQFWGPSVHWNTYLQKYVILLNRARDAAFTPGGVYISYSDPDLSRLAWTPPLWFMGPTQWYPQVIGLLQDRGTDKLAARYAHLKVGQLIRGVIQFGRPGETQACPPPGEDYSFKCRNGSDW